MGRVEEADPPMGKAGGGGRLKRANRVYRSPPKIFP